MVLGMAKMKGDGMPSPHVLAEFQDEEAGGIRLGTLRSYISGRGNLHVRDWLFFARVGVLHYDRPMERNGLAKLPTDQKKRARDQRYDYDRRDPNPELASMGHPQTAFSYLRWGPRE